MRIWGCSIAALAVGMMPYAASAQTAGAAQQQDQPSGVGTVPVQTPAPQRAATATDPTRQTGGSAAAPAAAAGAEPVVEDTGGDIVVTGQLEGAVQGNPRPELQLDPAAIASYSATTVAELLDQVSAQLGTDEPPVILLSGRRSSLAEVRSLPKESIGRIDILSEEVALRYGYSSTQKVVNIVLRRFRALTEQFDGQAPTEGGVAAGRIAENLTDIESSRRRLTVDASYWEASSLYESERGVSRDSGNLAYDVRGNVVALTGTEIDPALSAAAGSIVTVAGAPQAAANGRQPLSAFAANANTANVTDNSIYRTLFSPQRNLSLGASYAHDLSPSIDSSLTLEYSASESRSQQGLPNLRLRLPTGNPFSPFSRDVSVLRYYDGVGPQNGLSANQRFNAEARLNGEGVPWAASWRWTFEASASRNTRQSRNDRGVDATPFQALLTANSPLANPFGVIQPGQLTFRPDDVSNSRNTNASVTATTNGTLFALPAGNVTVNLRANGQLQRQTGDNTRNGVLLPTNISRDSGSLRGSIDLPITSTSLGVLDAIGSLSVNANFEVEQVSRFGNLTSAGYGINWTPFNALRANVSWTQDRNAPGANALADPVTVTPNVRAFDYVRNESVDITQITGGNPNLVAQDGHDFAVRFNIRPLTIQQGSLNFTASYLSRHNSNVIGSLPSVSAEVEAAFPERFTRDASGRLTAVDVRQVNFSDENYKEVRFGFNFFKSLPSPSARKLQERRQREQTAFRAALEESRRTGQPLPPEFTARMEEFRRQQQQQSIFGSRGGPGQNRGPGERQGANPGQAQAPGQGQGGGQGQNQGQGQNRGPGQGGQFGGGGFGGGGFGGGGGGGFRGGGGGGGFGGRGGGGGNGLRFNFTYVQVLKDIRVIRPGLPILDRLNGASGSRNVFNNSFGENRWGLYGRGGFGGGGTSRHNVQATAALNYESYLVQLDTSWVSKTFVNTGALGSTTRLNYDSFAKVDLTTQINFSRQFNTIRRIPFLQNTQVILNVDNLFNARRGVTDQNGVTPVNQDPRLRDPIGRLVRISLRKQFR